MAADAGLTVIRPLQSQTHSIVTTDSASQPSTVASGVVASGKSAIASAGTANLPPQSSATTTTTTAIGVPATGTEDGSTSSAPFSCNLCKRNYSRVDHLARHYRSHTREKPFLCETCGKDFARADLLRRHATNHNTLDSKGRKRQRQTSPATTSRVSQACTACAAAKLKCEEEKPCQRCQQRGVPCISAISDARPSVQQINPPPARVVNAPPPPMFNGNSNMVAGEVQMLLEMPQHSPFSGNGQMLPGPEQPLVITGGASSHGQPIDNMKLDPFFTIPNMNLPQSMHEMHHSPSLIQPRRPSSTMHSMEPNVSMFPDDSSLGDFLTDIMMPMTPSALDATMTGAFLPQPYTPRDVLDFGIDANYDLNDFDFGLISSWKEPRSTFPPVMVDDASCPPSRPPEVEDGQPAEVDNLGIEAFKKSLWSRWNPTQADDGIGEQINLSLPFKDMQASTMTDGLELRLCEERLDQTCRDRIMAMLFSTCEPAVIPRIVSSFPSAALLDSLMQQYICFHMSQVNPWIHLPTFRPNASRPEFIGMVIAAGALVSPMPALRKLGSAISEAVRLALPKSFEADNSLTRNVQVLQGYALQLYGGLWSGNKRKMEIAESHSLPLVTMMRRAGRFRRSRYSQVVPALEDEGKVLQEKWHNWVEVESMKRLSFHMMTHDAQTSMSFLIPPLISYAEMSLELPAALSLWQAKDAVTWKEIFMTKTNNSSRRLPSLTQCIHDLNPMLEAHDLIDFRLTTDIILHRIWSLIWDYRQLSSAQRQQKSGPSSNSSLISSSWHQELTRLLHNFRLTVSDWDIIQPPSILIQELLLLNLHVSFEELQMFAGKEGGEDARRVYPLLRSWVESRDSRQAVWHAGQVVRAATQFAPDQLRDFYAIALYHAGLAFWAYGIVSRDPATTRNRSSSQAAVARPNMELVCLDGEETPETQKFIALARSTPAIRKWSKNSHGLREAVPLDDARAVMDIIISILQQNVSGGSEAPPLVENLNHLMRDLGSAAGKVFRRK